jgi:hypothetical protein
MKANIRELLLETVLQQNYSEQITATFGHREPFYDEILRATQLYYGGQIRRMNPKVSGLAAWSENCKWYSSVPLGAVVSLFYESV